jgi:peptidoglycan/LPS O-acetylase OafA/YrhL
MGKRIKILDSMRGLAATIVVFHHVFTGMPSLFIHKYPAWLIHLFGFISNLNVQAVLFFFFISGFSICLSIKNEMPINKKAFNNYVYRRLKRILPLYYFAIVFTLLVGICSRQIGGNAAYGIKNLIGNMLFLQCSNSYAGNWFAPYGNNGPLWSLSFEMFYYFLLPVFLFLVLKFGKKTSLSLFTNRLALIGAFIISIACVFFNRFLFLPFVAFSALYYVWYAGYFTANLYLKKAVLFDVNFKLLILLTTILCTACCFFPLFYLHKKNATKFILLFENSFNFLFYKIGTGSFALYLLHYPVLQLLLRLGYTQYYYVGFTLISIIVCSIWLEKMFTKTSFLFLKRQYLK